MQLYAKIHDRESFKYERVVLCEFESESGDKVFIEEVEQHKEECFKVVVDEGYCRSTYYYPTRRYSITELSIYE
jgi:hypothetical protein